MKVFSENEMGGDFVILKDGKGKNTPCGWTYTCPSNSHNGCCAWCPAWKLDMELTRKQAIKWWQSV